jgi:molybdenum cofactor biosynthesis enzyme MoaA
MTCLYADPYLNLKRLIKEGASDIELKNTLQSAVKHKYKDGFVAEKARVNRLISESMSSIGG